MRLIDAEALFETLVTGDIRETHQFCYPCKKVLEAIDAQPTVEPQRMKGIWADGRCLRCGEHAPFHPMASTYYESNFCPNCGSDMRGDEDE